MVLKVIGKYFNDKKIFTFGLKDSQGFIIKAPRDHKGLAVILAEQPMINSPSLNNKPIGYEDINIQIYIESPTNNITEAMNMADNVYNHLLNNPKLANTGIKAVSPKRPIFIDEDEDGSATYLVEFDAKYTK